nr:ribonuclease H-like domain-containing protein [Tanacetum cinerariifolium]
MDINIDALYNILKKNQEDVNDAMGLKKKIVVLASDPLALIADKTKVSKRKENVVVSSDFEGSDADDFSELKKITALLEKAFNQRKFYSKPTNNNLRTSSTSQSANKKQEYVKSDDKKVEKKNDEKKRDMSKVKCYNCKKEDSEASSSSADDKIFEVSYYLSASESESEYETLEYYDKTTTYGVKSSEKVVSETENKSENDCQVIGKVCDSKENPNVIAPGMFKLSVSQSVSPISVTKTSCASNSVENTLSSVRRPKPSGVMWMKKGSSNTVKDDLSYVNHFNLNKNVKRYSRKNLMACNNSDTRNAFNCNNARNALCNARINAYVDVNDLFVFDDIVQICLWIIDLGCSKHMTGNRALLKNFVEMFLGTVRFGNNDFAVIAGYGDVVIGSMMINKVYYVEDGVDLLTGDRSSNLYTVALNEVASNSSACLLAKASSSQSLLWHQRLSHLNFDTINNLVKNNLVQGLLTGLGCLFVLGRWMEGSMESWVRWWNGEK